MNRRRLLSAAVPAAALTLVGAVATPAAFGPDAEMLALCGEFHRLHAEGANQANPDWERADAAAWDAFNQLDDMTPATEAGHRAKAGVAVRMLVMFHGGVDGGDPEAVFALNTLQGWLGRAA